MNKCLKLLLKNRINSIKAVQVQTQVKPGWCWLYNVYVDFMFRLKLA
jgi:hypothetical protein